MGQQLSPLRAAIFVALCLLAFAITIPMPTGAQGCEDCQIIKRGVPETTTGAVTSDLVKPSAGTTGAATPIATPPVTTPTVVRPSPPPPPVVRVVLYWLEGCGHCEEVLDGVLPQMQQKHGSRLEVRLIEVVTMKDIAAFYDLAAKYGFARGRAAVPFLLIGDRALSGEEPITAELPGLIESYLAQGGVDWPDVAAGPATGKPAAVPTDGCDLDVPCADDAGAASKGPVLDAFARAADRLSGAGIPISVLALWLAAVIGGALIAAVAVRAVRRRRSPAALPGAETAPAEPISRAPGDAGEDPRS
jgi:hypothetical protein